jgi:hypothetical protein
MYQGQITQVINDDLNDLVLLEDKWVGKFAIYERICGIRTSRESCV